MPDSRKHRGRHPNDETSFDQTQIPIMLKAAHDLAFLKSRNYADASSLKLVGDRYQLNARQRTAVARSTCFDKALQKRASREVDNLLDYHVYLDGFNLLTTIEATLGGGVLLIGQDGCLRDMSSMHGNYRVLADTERAIRIIHEYLIEVQSVSKITWYLDKPVSNSGRLKTRILDLANAFPIEVELLPDPDPVLKQVDHKNATIITADSGILNECAYWFNGARKMIEHFEILPRDYLIDFSQS